MYNETNLEEKLLTFKDNKYDYKSIVKEFEPKPVMEKFNEVFIK